MRLSNIMYPSHSLFHVRIVAAGQRFAGLFLVLLLLIPAGVASAQSVRTITFNEAVRIALERNVTLKRAQNNLQLQAVNVTSARADFLPNLNLSSSASRNWGLSFDLTSGSLVQTANDGVSLRANTGVNLFNGFGDVASLNQARIIMESNEYDFDRTRQAVVFNVIQTYLQVVLDREQISILQEDLESQNQQLARIEEFTNVGARPISDLYQQQAQQANSELQLLEAERASQISETRLIQVLQLDPLATYDFQAPDAEDFSLVPQSYSPVDLLQSAFEQRADLRAQEANIDAAREGIRIARSSLYPSLSLSGSFGTNFTSQRDDSFASQLGDNRSESVGFSLQVPIFNRLQTKTNVERARVQYDNAFLDLQNLQQTVAVEVRQAYLDYQSAVKRLDVTEKQLRASGQALQVEQERYDVGASTLVELTQARVTFVQASSNRAQAIFQFQFQNKLIEYYQGVLDHAQPLF